MEQTLNSSEMLERINCPAFLVEDGTIVCANESATQRQISVGEKIADNISVGAEEYSKFTEGKLCLTLSVCGATLNATVTKSENRHLFCLDSDYQEPELRAFALASQHLREPLANALTTANLLEGDDEQIAKLNRSLYQLHRAICNMSDAANYQSLRSNKTEHREIGSIFNEIMEKAAHMLSKGNHTLEYSGLTNPVNAMLDAEKLERALLNMISNAVKFSPKNSVISAELRHSGQKLYFSVKNTNIGNPGSNIFSHYLREPGIEHPGTGIGLGMSIVQKTASAHGGTLLLEQSEASGIRLTMTIAVQSASGKKLHSTVRYPVDYAGGYDHTLTELSDVLPAELYK